MYAIRSYYVHVDVITINPNYPVAVDIRAARWTAGSDPAFFRTGDIIHYDILSRKLVFQLVFPYYPRITSYNVCYTKLLREYEESHSKGQRIQDSRDLRKNGPEASDPPCYRILETASGNRFFKNQPRRRGVSDRICGRTCRITSYNVCYTKLLRERSYM